MNGVNGSRVSLCPSYKKKEYRLTTALKFLIFKPESKINLEYLIVYLKNVLNIMLFFRK